MTERHPATIYNSAPFGSVPSVDVMVEEVEVVVEEVEEGVVIFIFVK